MINRFKCHQKKIQNRPMMMMMMMMSLSFYPSCLICSFCPRIFLWLALAWWRCHTLYSHRTTRTRPLCARCPSSSDTRFRHEWSACIWRERVERNCWRTLWRSLVSPCCRRRSKSHTSWRQRSLCCHPMISKQSLETNKNKTKNQKNHWNKTIRGRREKIEDQPFTLANPHADLESLCARLSLIRPSCKWQSLPVSVKCVQPSAASHFSAHFIGSSILFTTSMSSESNLQLNAHVFDVWNHWMSVKRRKNYNYYSILLKIKLSYLNRDAWGRRFHLF